METIETHRENESHETFDHNQPDLETIKENDQEQEEMKYGEELKSNILDNNSNENKNELELDHGNFENSEAQQPFLDVENHQNNESQVPMPEKIDETIISPEKSPSKNKKSEEINEEYLNQNEQNEIDVKGKNNQNNESQGPMPEKIDETIISAEKNPSKDKRSEEINEEYLNKNEENEIDSKKEDEKPKAVTIKNESSNQKIQSDNVKEEKLEEQSQNISENLNSKADEIKIQNPEQTKQISEHENFLGIENTISFPIKEGTKNDVPFEHIETSKQGQEIEKNQPSIGKSDNSNQEEKSENQIVLAEEEKKSNKEENIKADDSSIPNKIEELKVEQNQVSKRENPENEKHNEEELQEEPGNPKNSVPNEKSIENQAISIPLEGQKEAEILSSSKNDEQNDKQHVSEELQEPKASNTNENPSKNDEGSENQQAAEELNPPIVTNTNENQIEKELISPTINLNEEQILEKSDKTEETVPPPSSSQEESNKEKPSEQQVKVVQDEIIEENNQHKENNSNTANNENKEINENNENQEETKENPAELEKKEKTPPLSPLGLHKKYSESSPKLEKTILHIVVEDENEEKVKKTEEMGTLDSERSENKPKILIDLSNVEKRTQVEYEGWNKEACLKLIKDNENNYFAYFQLTCLLFKVLILNNNMTGTNKVMIFV